MSDADFYAVLWRAMLMIVKAYARRYMNFSVKIIRDDACNATANGVELDAGV
jgi:hypothetical protein